MSVLWYDEVVLQTARDGIDTPRWKKVTVVDDLAVDVTSWSTDDVTEVAAGQYYMRVPIESDDPTPLLIVADTGDSEPIIRAVVAAPFDPRKLKAGPVETEKVPPPRTAVLVDTGDGLYGESPIEMHLEDEKLLAVDFRNDLSTGAQLASIVEIEIVSGTADGVVFTLMGVNGTQAKVFAQCAAAGDYVVRIKVTYDNQNISQGEFEITVSE